MAAGTPWDRLVRRAQAWVQAAPADARCVGRALFDGPAAPRRDVADAATAASRAGDIAERAAAEALGALARVEPACGFDAFDAAADASREETEARAALRLAIEALERAPDAGPVAPLLEGLRRVERLPPLGAG